MGEVKGSHLEWARGDKRRKTRLERQPGTVSWVGWILFPSAICPVGDGMGDNRKPLHFKRPAAGG